MTTISNKIPSKSNCFDIQQVQIRLQFDNLVEGKYIQGKSIRGAIAGRFLEEHLLHQHREDGSVEYRYPLVQYKRLGKDYLIVGFGHGAELVINLPMVQKQFDLEGTLCHLVSQEMRVQQIELAATEHPLIYSFLTPWLALNEENFARYQRSGMTERKRLLQRVLIGNILSMSKGLGYVVTQEIKVSQMNVYPVRTPVRLKGVLMTSFKGSFAVNFQLPDLIGLGKSVSRGFGTIKRLEAGRKTERVYDSAACR